MLNTMLNGLSLAILTHNFVFIYIYIYIYILNFTFLTDPNVLTNTENKNNSEHYLIKTIPKWALCSVQLTVGSTVGHGRNASQLAVQSSKHCVNRNGGVHSCAARQEGNYTLTQSSDSHSWSSAHKKHTVPFRHEHKLSVPHKTLTYRKGTNIFLV